MAAAGGDQEGRAHQGCRRHLAEAFRPPGASAEVARGGRIEVPGLGPQIPLGRGPEPGPIDDHRLRDRLSRFRQPGLHDLQAVQLRRRHRHRRGPRQGCPAQAGPVLARCPARTGQGLGRAGADVGRHRLARCHRQGQRERRRQGLGWCDRQADQRARCRLPGRPGSEVARQGRGPRRRRCPPAGRRPAAPPPPPPVLEGAVRPRWAWA